MTIVTKETYFCGLSVSKEYCKDLFFRSVLDGSYGDCRRTEDNKNMIVSHESDNGK